MMRSERGKKLTACSAYPIPHIWARRNGPILPAMLRISVEQRTSLGQASDEIDEGPYH